MEKAVRLQLIREFIQANERVPTTAELNDALTAVYLKVTKLPNRGLVRDNVPFDVNEASSASVFNAKMVDSKWNLDFVKSELEAVYGQISNRAFIVSNYLSTLERRLKKIDSEATALLLAKGFSSNLLYAVTEDFATDSKVQLDLTTVAVSAGSVTSSTEEFEDVSSAISKLTYTVISQAGYRDHKAYSTTDDMLAKDGSFWLLEVTSDVGQQNMTVAIEGELAEETDVNELVVSLAGATYMTATVYYSDSSKSYQLVSSMPADSGTLRFQVNSRVKYFRLLLTKTVADTTDMSGNYIYVYKVDAIRLGISSISSSDVLYCGPYSILDSFDDSVSFSHGQLSVCKQDTLKSWIEFYLSTDNATWIPVVPVEDRTGGSIISFNNTTVVADVIPINDALSSLYLDSAKTLDLWLASGDSYINQALPISYLSSVEPSHIKIRRNTTTYPSTVFDIPSGWVLDTDDGLYKTTFIVNSLEGVTLELGESFAFLNGLSVSGSVLVPSGGHTFSTSQGHWFDVATGLASESVLSLNDPLYPYNHKLLIEGYTYPSTFEGNKVYSGVGTNFGSSLKFVPKSVFDSSTELDIYTTVVDTDYIYFVVHTKKGYEDWVNETFDVTISVPDSENTQVYLKAVFRSSDNVSSSTLKSFSIRVG
jgi:hypothetical protein